MIPIRSVVGYAAAVAVGLVGACLIAGATTQPGPAPAPEDIQGILASVTPQPANEAPRFGNFYSAQFGDQLPPLPADTMNLPFWDLGGGFYLYDDRNVDYAALRAAAAAEAEAVATPGGRFSMMAASSFLNSYAYGNPVYLTNLAAILGSNSTTAAFSIVGGTNFVPYDILTTTNLGNHLSNWTWLGIGYTSNRYTFSNQPPSQAFYILAKPRNQWVLQWGGGVAPPPALSNAVAVAGGYDFGLSLKADGTVAAWGDDSHGQTNLPAGLTNVTVVVAGYGHGLALRADGSVTNWGSWYFNGSYHTPTNPATLTNVVAISAGLDHDLAAKADGTVVVWGYTNEIYNTLPSGLSGVQDVEAGWNHNVALLTNGTVAAWGMNYGLFGWNLTNVPSGLTNVVSICCGAYHTLALKADGHVVAWGAGNSLSSSNFADFGQAIVPAGLSNVVAIAAGGYHSMALKSDGTVAMWGDMGLPGYTLNQIVGIGSGVLAPLALRAGPMHPPVIAGQSPSGNEFVLYQANVTFDGGVTAPGEFSGYPLSYQWAFNGTNISGATSSNYTFAAANTGTYSVTVANAAGSTNFSWQLTVVYPGGIFPWGSNPNGEENIPPLTNVVSLAAGGAHGVVATDNGTVTNWGSYWTGTNYISVCAPPPLTNATAVAAGFRHDLALKADGTVVAWGLNDFQQTNVPPAATNIVALAAGGNQCLALKKDGTVIQWGQTNAPIPTGLANVTAVAAGTNFSLALLQNATVVAWGANNSGQTNLPAGLSNVVAIAAGGSHALALKQNGTVMAWGAVTNLPANLTNAMAVAAGENHNLALKNDGTVMAWGDNTFGQTNVPGGLNGVKLIAGGGAFSVAALFSPLVQYPVDVANDLLLIYNSSSAASATVLNYYLAHRPMVSNANVLPVGITNSLNYETVSPSDFTNLILAPVTNWLAANPTKRPEYVVLFLNVPDRVAACASDTNNYPFYCAGGTNFSLPSVSVQLATTISGWQPFVTHINMNGTNDCIGYINKLAKFGSNYSSGQIILSASAGGYGNTNYALDSVRHGTGYGQPFGPDANYSLFVGVVSSAANALLNNGVSTGAIMYNDGLDTIIITNSSTNYYYAPQITNSANVAGYMSWGAHSGLGAFYAVTTNGVRWTGNSGWWIIGTVESYNGQGQFPEMGYFIQWFSSTAFGGTNYSNTPIGAVTHVDEPFIPGIENSPTYFGLWSTEKNFAICAWNSRNTPYFQAVGDPLVVR